ncbi:Hypothetical_protein [Hexamita inflata]|uniref:Hypothetical_protein n=1 Tax=Hexamita inflata TaxID=28002 RepID=A0AA86QGC2_9EUKA|nr:Hypothetical protein HINF_LOCUS45313 [Hexamita inflata]
MLFSITLQGIASAFYNPTHGISVSKLSNITGVIDAIECEEAVYIVAQNKSVLAMGRHEGHFGQMAQLDFSYIKVDNVKQLFCVSGKLWYISNDGKLYMETLDNKRTIFEAQKMPEAMPVPYQIVGDEKVQFILTYLGLYFKGECDDEIHICGQLDSGTYSEFTFVPITPIIASNIRKIELTPTFLFIYLKIDEVFALGQDQAEILPIIDEQSSLFQKKIGNGLNRVFVGFNLTTFLPAMYYLKNKNLYVYQKAETLIQTGVYDIIGSSVMTMMQILLLVKDNHFEYTIEQHLPAQSPSEIYCIWNKQNPLCGQPDSVLSTECYDEQTGELKTENEYCKIVECETNSMTTIDCLSDQCGESDLACQALQCNQLTAMFNKKCYYNYSMHTYTAQFTNAKDYNFMNSILISQKDSIITPEAPKTDNTMKTGVAVGIAVGTCVGVFALLLIITCVICNKKTNQTKQKDQKRTLLSVRY